MRKLLTRSMLLSALLLLVVPAALAAQVAEDEFTIELPMECGEVQKQQQRVDSPSGPIDLVTYLARAEDGAACIVTYSELSGPITDAESTINSGRDSLVQQLNVTVETERELSVDGYEGRMVRFTTDQPRPIYGRSDFVVADDRLYQVIYIGFSYDARELIEQAGLFSSLSISGPVLEDASVDPAPETATTAANNQG
jgi:hypothetical protein